MLFFEIVRHQGFFFYTCMIMNSSVTCSWLMSPGGRSNRKDVFHTVQEDPPLVSLLLITTPSWCRLINTWYSAYRHTNYKVFKSIVEPILNMKIKTKVVTFFLIVHKLQTRQQKTIWHTSNSNVVLIWVSTKPNKCFISITFCCVNRCQLYTCSLWIYCLDLKH